MRVEEGSQGSFPAGRWALSHGNVSDAGGAGGSPHPHTRAVPAVIAKPEGRAVRSVQFTPQLSSQQRKAASPSDTGRELCPGSL